MITATLARITTALLALWVGGGLVFEAALYVERRVERAETRATAARLVAERNLAQAHRFIAACLRGEPAPLGDELLYDCQAKQMQLRQRHVRGELNELQRVNESL